MTGHLTSLRLEATVFDSIQLPYVMPHAVEVGDEVIVHQRRSENYTSHDFMFVTGVVTEVTNNGVGDYQDPDHDAVVVLTVPDGRSCRVQVSGWGSRFEFFLLSKNNKAQTPFSQTSGPAVIPDRIEVPRLHTAWMHRRYAEDVYVIVGYGVDVRTGDATVNYTKLNDCRVGLPVFVRPMSDWVHSFVKCEITVE